MSNNYRVVNIVNKTSSKNREIMKRVYGTIFCFDVNMCLVIIIYYYLSRFQTTEARELAPLLDMTLANISAHLQSQGLTP